MLAGRPAAGLRGYIAVFLWVFQGSFKLLLTMAVLVSVPSQQAVGILFALRPPNECDLEVLVTRISWVIWKPVEGRGPLRLLAHFFYLSLRWLGLFYVLDPNGSSGMWFSRWFLPFCGPSSFVLLLLPVSGVLPHVKELFSDVSSNFTAPVSVVLHLFLVYFCVCLEARGRLRYCVWMSVPPTPQAKAPVLSGLCP